MIAEAAREEDWLRHATDELGSPGPGGRRRGPPRHRTPAPAAGRTPGGGDRRCLGRNRPARPPQRLARPPRLRAASPAPCNAWPPRRSRTRPPPHMAALERAEDALAEAETIARAALPIEAEADPQASWSSTEERLFALRAAARKHNIPVVELPALLASLRQPGSSRARNRHRRAIVAARNADAAACPRRPTAAAAASLAAETSGGRRPNASRAR